MYCLSKVSPRHPPPLPNVPMLYALNAANPSAFERVATLKLSNDYVSKMSSNLYSGEFHDQGDAKWIVIRGQLRGHKDMPLGGQSPAGLLAAQELAALRAYLVV
jgi:hypothetical protein